MAQSHYWTDFRRPPPRHQTREWRDNPEQRRRDGLRQRVRRTYTVE